MHINIAKSSGFCFGVKRAIEISTKLSSSKKPVYVLGDIVHNNFVVKDLEEKGLRRLKRITSTKNATLIVRAHGAPKKTFEKARSKGYKIVDATCPMVKDIYKIAKKLEKTHKIIIIGDTGHDEVKGISGQLNNRSITIASVKDISVKQLSRVKKAAVITQSTQSRENIDLVMRKLKKIIPDIKLYDTTCQITRVKQREIKILPEDNDVILIIGSKTSANTKRLYQISRNINKKTYWIESKKDIKPSWFKNIESVGIMSGASTPDYVTKEVVNHLKTLTTND